MAVTEHPVRVDMSARGAGWSQGAAAAKAGFSERTGRRVEPRGGCGSRPEPRRWRTREDPFVEVWEAELEPMLSATPALQAIPRLEWFAVTGAGALPGCTAAHVAAPSEGVAGAAWAGSGGDVPPAPRAGTAGPFGLHESSRA
jgi:hypothetical protein